MKDYYDIGEYVWTGGSIVKITGHPEVFYGATFQAGKRVDSGKEIDVETPGSRGIICPTATPEEIRKEKNNER